MRSHLFASALASALASCLGAASLAQAPKADAIPDAAMLRFPDIGSSQIVFQYANDLWVVPREGGVASPLANPPGPELFPKFSPDGRSIAFVGNYDGNRDLYVMPAVGGAAQRVTHHPAGETLCDFAPDGRLIFYSNGLAGLQRQSQLFTVPVAGGLPEQLPVPYGTTGAISPDGTWLAYTPHTTDFRTWKRYRGGMATDIWLLNLKDGTSRRMTDWEGTDTSPMWVGTKVYYLSDAGPEHRQNIFSWDAQSGARTQLTNFADFDVKFPSVGPGPNGSGEIVFTKGASLHVFDVASGAVREVKVSIPGDRPRLRPNQADAARTLGERSISPSGKRVAASARGDVWSLPAEHGSPRNLTRTSGAFERSPSWSPDGRWIAYLSDESGEYEFYLMQSDGKYPPERITFDGQVFRNGAIWSPDSKKFLFTDKTGTLWLHTLGELETPAGAEGAAGNDPKEPEGAGGKDAADAESKSDGDKSHGDATDGEKAKADADPADAAPPKRKPGQTTRVDRDPWTTGLQPSWSHDSRWIAYQRSSDKTPQTHVRLYDTTTGVATPVTSGMFNEGSPTFDRKGDWLYFTSSRSFGSPTYEDVGTTFVYGGTEVILAAPLRKDVKNPLLPKSDEESWKDAKKSDRKDSEKEGDEKKEGDGEKGGKKEENGDKEKGDGQKAAAADDGVSGTWDLVLSGIPDAPALPVTARVKVAADGTVTGSFDSVMGAATISSGTWNAATRTLDVSFSTPDGGAGTLRGTVDGGSITGTWSMGPTSGAFTGARSAKSSAEPPAEGGNGETAKGDQKSDEKKAGDKKAPKTLEIDLEGFEARAIELPLPPGVFGSLAVNDGGALVFVRRSARGAGGGSTIKLFDLKDDKREEKTVAAGGGFEISADGKKLLSGNSIMPASAGATGKPIVTQGMTVLIDPRAEWAQMVQDAWRIFRDWFYDPNMHHVDWKAVGDRYKAMVADCASREDVAYVISEMISELNVGHAYYQGGGDIENSPSVPVGLLGCDFELDSAAQPPAYRLKRIPTGGAWDSDSRGPLTQFGVDAKVGDYLLAVNGVPLDASRDPWSAFIGLVGRPVTLTLSAKPVIDSTAREVIVTPTTSEADSRFRDWIERNRAHVEKKSGGRVGYIYVPDTGVNGQNNLFRQFYGQRHLDALIIDERWNGGGQIPTRFIELLNRPATNFWARRDGADWRWPPDSHQGPKCMLINGLAGSGGDAFPHYFRQAGLGKLIGTRTWGGLVGISGNPALIDGATIAVPTFGFYEADGTWGIEGHGVDPDIEVIDDPALMADGGDPQLDAAIDHMLQELQRAPYVPPTRPPSPDRSGMGIPKQDR